MNRAHALLLSCVALLLGASVHAQDQRDAQRRLQQVRKELNEVAAERRKLEGSRGDAARELREVDEQVGAADRALRQTQATLARDGGQLAQLQAQRAQLDAGLADKRAELARLLRAAHVGGQAAPLKALLAQDRINAANRSLAYHGYLQRDGVARIRALTAELVRVQTLETQIAQRQATLAAEQQRQDAQLRELAQARNARQSALAGIEARYKDRAARERALGQDARALQQLLSQLRAAAERARREAAAARAREQAQARRQAQAERRTGGTQGTRRPSAPRQVAAAAPVRQVGGMGWPVSGSLLAGFGGTLPDGRRSNGVMIAAAAGTQVKAAGDGRVVFADWMTGYGNILIIDHGGGYMSLYAHNDGLLKSVGDAVRRGDTVASVGSSGGLERPALYFELRRGGAPVNPAQWLQR